VLKKKKASKEKNKLEKSQDRKLLKSGFGRDIFPRNKNDDMFRPETAKLP
jgi:hypothetical protein